MSEIKKGAAKHTSSKTPAMREDLDGIKKVLLFYVEREREKELSEAIHKTFSGRWQSNEAREDYQKRIKKEINKKYNDLTKGLK